VVVTGTRDELASDVETVGRPKQLVVGFPEVELEPAPERILACELDPAVDETPDRVPGRGKGAV
jgi:hypothetical protein